MTATYSNQQFAAAYGAQVSLAAPGTGLYLVVGRTAEVLDDVRSVGGQIVMVIPGSMSILVLMQTTAFLQLKGKPSIAHVGPVSIDSAQFNQFLTLVGLQKPE